MAVFGHKEDKSKAEIGIKLIRLTISNKINSYPGSFININYLDSGNNYTGYEVIGIPEIDMYYNPNGGSTSTKGTLAIANIYATVANGGILQFNCSLYHPENDNTTYNQSNNARLVVTIALAKKDIIES